MRLALLPSLLAQCAQWIVKSKPISNKSGRSTSEDCSRTEGRWTPRLGISTLNPRAVSKIHALFCEDVYLMHFSRTPPGRWTSRREGCGDERHRGESVEGRGSAWSRRAETRGSGRRRRPPRRPRTPLRGRGGAGERLRVGRVVPLDAHRGETPLWLSGMAQRDGRGRPPRERS